MFMAGEGDRSEKKLDTEVVRLRQERAAIEHSGQAAGTSAFSAQQAEVNQMKADLLASLAHEMRTPLAAIKGHATLLLDYDSHLKRDEKREYLQAIDKATDRLDQLLANFLDNARLEAGMLKLKISAHQVSDLLKEALIPYESHQLPGDRSLSLIVDDDLPGIAADSRRLKQVIGHLVDNAVKYSTPGTEIAVRARLDGRNILMSIANKGSNIPPQDAEAIFQPLSRLEQRDAEASGSRLNRNLALCKAIVDMHGGTIRVESREGQNTVLFISLPTADTVQGEGLGTP